MLIQSNRIESSQKAISSRVQIGCSDESSRAPPTRGDEANSPRRTNVAKYFLRRIPVQKALQRLRSQDALNLSRGRTYSNETHDYVIYESRCLMDAGWISKYGFCIRTGISEYTGVLTSTFWLMFRPVCTDLDHRISKRPFQLINTRSLMVRRYLLYYLYKTVIIKDI